MRFFPGCCCSGGFGTNPCCPGQSLPATIFITLSTSGACNITGSVPLAFAGTSGGAHWVGTATTDGGHTLTITVFQQTGPSSCQVAITLSFSSECFNSSFYTTFPAPTWCSPFSYFQNTIGGTGRTQACIDAGLSCSWSFTITF